MPPFLNCCLLDCSGCWAITISKDAPLNCWAYLTKLTQDPWLPTLAEVFGDSAALPRTDWGGGASCRLVMSALMTSAEPPAAEDARMLGPQADSVACENTLLQLKHLSPYIEVCCLPSALALRLHLLLLESSFNLYTVFLSSTLSFFLSWFIFDHFLSFLSVVLLSQLLQQWCLFSDRHLPHTAQGCVGHRPF